ncbi:hypothetical protein GCM10027294_53040 [Marinactinospora endophytica]
MKGGDWVARPAERRFRVVRPEEVVSPPVKPATVEPVSVHLKAHQRLVVENDPDHTLYDFYGGPFYFASREFSAQLAHVGLTATEHNVWLFLLGNQERGGVIPWTQREMAARLEVDTAEISRALKTLLERGIIWRPRKGVYRINPRVAFFGRSGQQAEALSEMPSGLPELNLSPKRKARQKRGGREGRR